MSEPSPQPAIVRGAPTEEELAALIAVVSEAYAHESEEAVAEQPPVSVWQRTQRGLRRPLRRDIPWGRFSG
ncbi:MULTISPECIES: acyl-CoA carboxylase subunit epsilon [Microbacterium]|uniref:acyl-CoA carboxylase subunit epsilon n=1 Tax=Microbacterium TaxID=33882 RepID=UPI00217EA3A2|nr:MULTISPECIES: acyl-CoA carboxylase subunit epsilon [Microbacterium]UWF76895.1 acyl-CoA carboxylase subunit epsilon [Microbacterium neungamense]WCM55052.1 acyl-CoA carboxylase subunit epsilon [Microbacterium sp. EF45047]